MPKKTAIFNPVKEEKDGVRARRVIWSTQSLDLALKAINEGKRLIANPFYENNSGILKADLNFQRTQEEIDEWIKCKDDIIYFVEKYCKLLTPQGIRHVELRDYQVRYLKHVQKNQLSIGLTPRQAGKSTTTSLAMLHYLLFNFDKNALVCSNKRKSAVEVIDKVKKIYTEIPYFLKPGIHKWNEAEIVMDNGCRIQAEATTINSGIGNTIHFLLLDEFAHIQPNILDKFYNNIFPVVTAAKAKCAIISTQNGRNLFYRLFIGAKRKENDYVPFEITWRDVPEWNPEKLCWEQRDEIWHRKQVANYGSEEAFNNQFGTNFDISSNTLISQKYLNTVDVIKFENKDLPGVLYNESWYWHPDIDPTNLRKEYIVLTCDLAEGVGGDYTVYSIYRLVPNGVECIGYFRNNELPREQYATTMLTFCTKWLDPNKYILSFEKNTYGDIFFSNLQSISEQLFPEWDWSCVVKYYKDSGKYDMGIKLTPGNKSPHCILFKEAYELGRIVNQAEDFVYEIQNFCDTKMNGHYEASYGHDDMVMTGVQLEFVKKELQYKLLREAYESENMIDQDNMYNPYDLINPQQPINNIYDAISINIPNDYGRH